MKGRSKRRILASTSATGSRAGRGEFKAGAPDGQVKGSWALFGASTGRPVHWGGGVGSLGQVHRATTNKLVGHSLESTLVALCTCSGVAWSDRSSSPARRSRRSRRCRSRRSARRCGGRRARGWSHRGRRQSRRRARADGGGGGHVRAALGDGIAASRGAPRFATRFKARRNLPGVRRAPSRKKKKTVANQLESTAARGAAARSGREEGRNSLPRANIKAGNQ